MYISNDSVEPLRTRTRNAFLILAQFPPHIAYHRLLAHYYILFFEKGFHTFILFSHSHHFYASDFFRIFYKRLLVESRIILSH